MNVALKFAAGGATAATAADLPVTDPRAWVCLPISSGRSMHCSTVGSRVTPVVVLMLVEEGKLDLAVPLSRYLPEFNKMTVATGSGSEGTIQMEPAKGQITIHDLLRHTAGLTYGFVGKGQAREALKAENPGNGEKTNREIARAIGGLPLEHQPGTAWDYSRATDVLGAVIEEIEGSKLSAVL